MKTSIEPFEREQLINEAFALHQANDLLHAQELYQRVLERLPNDFVCLHMLGVTFHQLGNLSEAERLLTKAVSLGELTPEVHYNLGNVYLALDKREQARKCFARALELKGDFQLAQQQLQVLESFGLMQPSKSTKNLRKKNKQVFQRVSDPLPSKLLMKGLTAQERGDIPEAIRYFQATIDQKPDEWAALFSLGRLLTLGGRPAEGLALIDRQIAINPGFAAGYQMRATALDMLGRYEEAIAAVDVGIRIDPTDFEALNRKVIILLKIDCAEEAIRVLQVILSIKPDHELTLSNLGTVLNSSRRFSEATDVFKRLLDVNPHHNFTLGAWVYNRLHIADWTGYADNVQKICSEVQAGRPVCLSLPMMSMSNESSDHQKCAQLFAENFFRKKLTPFWNGERYSHEKIRVAYVSADLREHPVGHLLAGVIERHDKSKFELIGVSTSDDDGSVLRQRFKAAFDHFLDVRSLSDLDLGKLVRSYEPDIVVDLAGYTQGAKTLLFIDRVAPVQVNYLGFPGTMGLDCMDYIIADPHTIPDSDEAMFTEKIACLPDTYLPTDSNLLVSDTTPTREDCGLPSEGFVFCSFNHIFKINPIIFEQWMRILAAVPGSVLWLSKPSTEAIDNLRRSAEASGVAGDRLIFAARVPKVADHLARYRNAGLFLDTLPYNAHTTAADALFVGLPVLTCTGGAFPGRVATGLLNAMGMQELICNSLEEYTRTAIALASDAQRLHQIRQKVLHQKSITSLFNTDLYTRNLELAFQEMVRRQRKGLAPESFKVSDVAADFGQAH